MVNLTAARTELDDLIRRAPGTVGLVIEDLTTGERLEWSPETQFLAASIIKIPILVEGLRQAEEGTVRLDQMVPVPDDAKVGGFGILKELTSVTSISLLDLLTLMIIVSDNTATNLCIDVLGVESINRTIASLGLTGTQLQRKMMDYEARDRGLENFTTPADVARLLRLIATRQILTPEACDLALDIMARQQVRDRLPLYLPDDMRVAHKTGELSGVRHDAGVIFFESDPVIVVALTQGFSDQLSQSFVGGDASALIAQIPRVLLKHQRS